MATTCSREAFSSKVPSMSNNSSKSALIVVDMINSYDFEDADRLRRSVEQALPRMVDLVERAREQDVKTIYVNDNYGAWQKGRDELVEEVLAGRFPELVEPIAPGDDADFRHFEVHVPPDAVAHIHEDLAEAALKMMETNMSADLTPAERLLSD